MGKLPRERRRRARAARAALALCLLQSAAACQSPDAAMDAAAPFVLTARGDPVRANSPPKVKVTVGAKRVLPAGEPSPPD